MSFTSTHMAVGQNLRYPSEHPDILKRRAVGCPSPRYRRFWPHAMSSPACFPNFGRGDHYEPWTSADAEVPHPAVAGEVYSQVRGGGEKKLTNKGWWKRKQKLDRRENLQAKLLENRQKTPKKSGKTTRNFGKILKVVVQECILLAWNRRSF